MSHRHGCTFGPGLYRIVLADGSRHFCQDEREVVQACSLLREGAIKKVQRDGYCLDQEDLQSPDIIEGKRFLGMPKREAMAELGVASDAEYQLAYRAIEEAVLANDRRGGQASVVIKKKGKVVLDIDATESAA